jgi:hypothetical protein
MTGEINIPLDGTEAIRATTNIGTVGNIIEDMGVSVKHGVHETNRTLALMDTLLVDLKDKEKQTH